MGLMEPLGSTGRKSPLEKRRREERGGQLPRQIPGQVGVVFAGAISGGERWK